MSCVMPTLLPSALPMEPRMDHTMVPDHRIVAAENPLGQVTVQVQLCENHVQKPRCEDHEDGWCSEDDCIADTWNPTLYSLQLKAPKAVGIFCPHLVPSLTQQSHFGDVFHGLIARAEAAEILHSHQDGCFLVREASSGKQIVSVMFDQRMVNYTIHFDGQHYCLDEKQFDTLDGLVNDILISLYIEAQFNIGEQLEQARTVQRTRTLRKLKRYGNVKRSGERRKRLEAKKADNNLSESDLDSPLGSLQSLCSSPSPPPPDFNNSPTHDQGVKIRRKGARRKKLSPDAPMSASCSALLASTVVNDRRTYAEGDFGICQTINEDASNKARSLPKGCSAPELPSRNKKFHNFKLTTYKSLTWCAVCHHFMWGLTQQGSRCQDCGMDVHKQCIVTAAEIKCQPNRKMIKKVFGVDLTTLTALEETTIPQFLVQGIKELEDRGLSVEGIYRVSGFSRVVKDMKERVDAGENIDFSSVSDVHTITGSIKLFLRDLPIPLITYSAYPHFISFMSDLDSESNSEISLSSMRELLHSRLPRAHYDTLKYLLQHLHKIDQLSATSKMHADNLAVVFAPTIMRNDEISNEQSTTSLNDIVIQKKLVSYLIKNVYDLFCMCE